MITTRTESSLWSDHKMPFAAMKPISSDARYRLYTGLKKTSAASYPCVIQPDLGDREPFAVFRLGNGLPNNIYYHKGGYLGMCRHEVVYGYETEYGLFFTGTNFETVYKGPHYSGDYFQFRAGSDGASGYPGAFRIRSAFPKEVISGPSVIMLLAARELTATRIRSLCYARGRGTGGADSFTYELNRPLIGLDVQPAACDTCIYRVPNQVIGIGGENAYLYVVHAQACWWALSPGNTDYPDKMMIGLGFSVAPTSSDYIHLLDMLFAIPYSLYH